MPSPSAAEFRAAGDAAVASWRFRPAERCPLKLVNRPGGDYPRVMAREDMAGAGDVETWNSGSS